MKESKQGHAGRKTDFSEMEGKTCWQCWNFRPFLDPQVQIIVQQLRLQAGAIGLTWSLHYRLQKKTLVGNLFTSSGLTRQLFAFRTFWGYTLNCKVYVDVQS